MENKNYIVAIDLGTNNVATVVGVKNADGRVSIIDCEASPVQGMVRGEIKNIELVAQSIKSTVEAIEKRLSIKIKEAYAGVSGQHIRCVKYPYFVFIGRDGEIREEDVCKLHESMSNVQAPEGETIIDIVPQNYIVDGEETESPVGTFGNKLEATFNFILGDTNAISRINRALARIEIKQLGLFLNAAASAEAVATEDEKQEGVAVVDIGGGTTEVTVFHGNVMRSISIIPLGGNAVNKDIRSYGILERNVENLKIKYGTAMRELAQPDKFVATPGLNARVSKEISFLNLAAIIEARMQDIIDYVIAEIKASGYYDKLSAGVILTGGCSQLNGIDKLFKSHTGVDVRVASAELECSAECFKLASAPSFATAIGLLLKGLETGKTTRIEHVRPVASIQNPMFSTPSPAQSIVHTINDTVKVDASFTDEQDSLDDNEAKKRGGIFGKLRRKFDTMFDVIEDNEI